MIVLKIIFWLVFSIIFMSLVEYSSHRWPMHDHRFDKLPYFHAIFEKHVHFHHSRFYQNFDDETDPVAKYINLDMSPVINVFIASFIWVPISLFLSLIGGFILASVVFIHALCFNAIHREMHEPKGRWFVNMSFYKRIRANHKKHHDKPNCNFNVILLGMDHIFGTYQKPDAA